MSDASRNICKMKPDSFASELLLVHIPWEQNEHFKLDFLSGRFVLEPLSLMSSGDVRFFKNSLRANDDALQIEMNVRKRGEQLRVELPRSVVSEPPLAGLRKFIDAILRERGEKARNVSTIFRDGMNLPEPTDLMVKLWRDFSVEKIPDRVRHVCLFPLSR